MRLYPITGSEELDAFDFRLAEKLGLDVGWYSYEYGNYEGGGYLVGRTVNGKWLYKDLGHCSCYSPMEGDIDGIFDSLDDVEAHLLHEEAADVIAAARTLVNEV